VTSRVHNVLFLCTGNTSRSILAEGLLSHLGRGRFHAYSAGSHPKGIVNPFAVEELRQAGVPVAGLRSKSWDEFAVPGAPSMDFVFTVCDNAASEACPVWPGHPMTAHWGVEDPAAVEGTDDEKRRAFRTAGAVLRRRIELFLSLPMEKLDEMAIRKKVTDIGKQ
jgi:protein-tyrosine-phosphatase